MVVMEVALSTLASRAHQQNFIFCSSTDLKVFVLAGHRHLVGDTRMIQLNWKLRVTPGQFGIFRPPSQWIKEGIMELAGVYDPDELLDHKHLCLKTKLIKIQVVPWGCLKVTVT